MNEHDIAVEARAVSDFHRLVNKALDAADPISRWGDGNGGYLLDVFRTAMEERGYWKKPESNKNGKSKISHVLRRKVLERDKYRCVECGTHIDLSIDHIHPESKGGGLAMDNLQTLCRSCNSRKGATV